ncbi:Xaa-pro aminopeptidase [Taphrina deformans PYCC 5710]|uniref:Xaa-pro aminopeptidase n=1 Tax=Taphrina deformans (strain PYCC 5710 / ATCC 11124 / CBS 356.35 / IMI 108563 / JCM 9778 / NBRC 8474) TaxID=1097556 RepID=R4XFB1_TAPDE|nr:Xaa-pro aminopeptidase [Taphrina deformans PYCC 5710]|eukprot:CCG82042.1 Xaa-pro aminopeptidase [Taphrina deformans PYCC 5710]
MTVDTSARVQALRTAMSKENLSYYCVPSEDSHASEYTAACDERRAYISGFDGSAGIAVVGQKQCYLFTDGRYFNQASQQIDDNWRLMKQGLPNVPTWQEFLIENVQRTAKVGIDASLLPLTESLKLQDQLKSKGAELVGQEHNLIDAIWSDRPAAPSNAVLVHPVKYAGASATDKLKNLRKFLKSKDADSIVISSLDEIAWLFNLRGSDVPFNPIFFAYATVTMTSSTLFVDSDKLSQEVRSSLPQETEIKSYKAIFDSARALGKSASKILIGSKGSWALASALGSKVESVRSPIGDAKSIKNDTEMVGMKECHIRDGAALIEYFYEMTQLAAKNHKIDEVDAATILENNRKAKDHFVGLSFPTISSTGANGAIIHYKPEKDTCAVIDWSKIYLCDSGAQYKDGTTDITRTWHFKEPSAFERKAFTLVLKGHIAIATAVFPRGTTGYTLDTLARQYLWREGLDYFHGTSHGVGSYLNVHEPPIGIGTRITFNEVPFSVGNVISNEPGFYLDGQFGIRIENIITCTSASTEHKFGDREYLGFDTISLAPLCKNLIDATLLSDAEKRWVDGYHRKTLDKVGPHVNEQVRHWLEEECSPLKN